MDIVKAEKHDIVFIMEMISECIASMENQGIYQWNKAYPGSDLIEEDIKNGFGYIFKDNGRCIAYVALNEEQAPEYDQITWADNDSKPLVVHRLSVHPEAQGRGIAKRVMGYIEDYAAKNKYSCIRLDAYSGNPAALNLYKSMGYRRLGQILFPFRDLPFYCFEKVL